MHATILSLDAIAIYIYGKQEDNTMTFGQVINRNEMLARNLFLYHLISSAYLV